MAIEFNFRQAEDNGNARKLTGTISGGNSSLFFDGNVIELKCEFGLASVRTTNARTEAVACKIVDSDRLFWTSMFLKSRRSDEGRFNPIEALGDDYFISEFYKLTQGKDQAQDIVNAWEAAMVKVGFKESDVKKFFDGKSNIKIKVAIRTAKGCNFVDIIPA